MRFQTSLGLTLFTSFVLANTAYAENCGISYYCYRSMTPGPAPVEPIATSRPIPAGSTRPTNLQQARPVPAQATRIPTTTTRPASPIPANQRLIAQQRAQTQADQQRLANQQRRTINPPATTTRTPNNAELERLAAQQRAQTLADQQRLANLRRNTSTTERTQSSTPVAPRVSTSTPTTRVNSTQSCSTLALKIKVLESQATSYARSQQTSKAQSLFKTADELRKEAQAQKCS